VADIVREALLGEEPYCPLRVEVVEEPRNVEEDQGPGMSGVARGLYAVGEDGSGVRGCMVGPGAELRYREEVVGADVMVKPLGDDLLQHLTDTLEEADWVIGLWVAVVGLVQLVEDDDGGVVPRVGPGL